MTRPTPAPRTQVGAVHRTRLQSQRRSLRRATSRPSPLHRLPPRRSMTSKRRSAMGMVSHGSRAMRTTTDRSMSARTISVRSTMTCRTPLCSIQWCFPLSPRYVSLSLPALRTALRLMRESWNNANLHICMLRSFSPGYPRRRRGLRSAPCSAHSPRRNASSQASP